jgi:hypothetical protein
MTRFIFFCMAIVALSFFVVPVFTGISKEHGELTTSADLATASNDSLSFEEIYELAGSTDNFDGAALNSITPAAGGYDSDEFSTGFSGTEDSALENSTFTIIKEAAPEASN